MNNIDTVAYLKSVFLFCLLFLCIVLVKNQCSLYSVISHFSSEQLKTQPAAE